MPRPKKFYDESGFCRVTLKKGTDRQPGAASASGIEDLGRATFAPGPHAQYVQGNGRRVNQNGMPVKRTSPAAFPRIVWDFEDEPEEDLGEAPLDVEESSALDANASFEALMNGDAGLDFDEVATLAFKSPTLYRALQELDARAFSLSEGPRAEGNAVLVSVGRILIDRDRAARTSLTGEVARELGRVASVLPKVSARDAERATFARENAAISVREEAEAVLFAANARSEIIEANGPDVGVPDATGEMLAAAEAARSGGAAKADALAVIGPGVLSTAPSPAGGEGESAALDASARYQALWSRVHERLTSPTFGHNSQALIDAVHRLATLPSFDRAAISSLLGAPLYDSPVSNPEHLLATVVCESGPFSSAELTEPGPYSRLTERRLVLVPSGSPAISDLAGWYGPGLPVHLDGRAEEPMASVAYVTGGQEIALSFSVDEGDVRFVTIRRPR